MSDEDYEQTEIPQISICGCGCDYQEHDEASGRCLYCSECDGFQEDDDATIIALATMNQESDPR